MLSENILVTRKSLLPVRITHDKNWIRTRSLCLSGENQPAERGLNAKRREIIAGDTSDDAMVAPIVGGQATKSETEGKDIAKGSGLIAEIHKSG